MDFINDVWTKAVELVDEALDTVKVDQAGGVEKLDKLTEILERLMWSRKNMERKDD